MFKYANYEKVQISKSAKKFSYCVSLTSDVLLITSLCWTNVQKRFFLALGLLFAVSLCLGEPVSVCRPTGERYFISDSVQCYRYIMLFCASGSQCLCRATGERYFISDSVQCDRYILEYFCAWGSRCLCAGPLGSGTSYQTPCSATGILQSTSVPKGAGVCAGKLRGGTSCPTLCSATGILWSTSVPWGEPVAVCRATGERNFLSGSAECDR